jgi:hypothetical protein
MHGPDLQPNIDELSRPQRLVRVVEPRLQLDRAGGLVDLIIDQLEHTLAQLGFIVAREGSDRQRLAGLGGGNRRQPILRQGEDR